MRTKIVRISIESSKLWTEYPDLVPHSIRSPWLNLHWIGLRFCKRPSKEKHILFGCLQVVPQTSPFYRKSIKQAISSGEILCRRPQIDSNPRRSAWMKKISWFLSRTINKSRVFFAISSKNVWSRSIWSNSSTPKAFVWVSKFVCSFLIRFPSKEFRSFVLIRTANRLEVFIVSCCIRLLFLSVDRNNQNAVYYPRLF